MVLFIDYDRAQKRYKKPSAKIIKGEKEIERERREKEGKNERARKLEQENCTSKIDISEGHYHRFCASDAKIPKLNSIFFSREKQNS